MQTHFIYRSVLFWSLLWAGISAEAGGGPQNVLIIANQNSARSMEMGNLYRELRGIPAAQLFPINVTTNYNIDTAAFSNDVRGPVLAYLAETGLSNQINYLVFSRDIPYRVYYGVQTNRQWSSITSSMFYGFKKSPDAFIAGCNLATNTDHTYFAAEHAFDRATSSGAALYPATMLTAYTIDQHRRLLDRSIAADYTQPTGRLYLAHSTDVLRNGRWPRYEDIRFALRFLDASADVHLTETGDGDAPTNTLGYTIGATLVSQTATFDFQPGAIAEHLTSFGGFLFDSASAPFDSGQMSILHWIAAGAAGSYGTLVEPCAYPEKFPDPLLYYWYARGFNLAEAMYMSVHNPYQGIVIGDPLTQPYARPPAVNFSWPTPYASVTGTLTVAVAAQAAVSNQTVDRIDLFLDDRWVGTMTNVPPRESNTVSATINGDTRTYTVEPGDGIEQVASGLATEINAAPPLPVSAVASGDRIELRQTALGVAGTDITYRVESALGGGSEWTVFGYTPGTNLVESLASAMRIVRLKGTASSGAVVRATVTRQDGGVFTNEVIAQASYSAYHLMTNLMAIVNGNTNLQNSTGCFMRLFSWGGLPMETEAVFVSRTNSWPSYNPPPQVNLEVIGAGLYATSESGPFDDQNDALAARGTLFLHAGRTNLTASYALDTTLLADGPHTLRAVGYDGSALRTQGAAVVPFVVSNFYGACNIVDPVYGATLAGLTTVTVHAVQMPGVITSVQFYVQGKWHSDTNAAPALFVWDPMEHGAGLIVWQARAFGDGGESYVSPTHIVRVNSDTDGDGLPDEWEYEHFGGITNAIAGQDTDEDGRSNAEEYIAGTDPKDDQHYFAVTSWAREESNDLFSITFTSHTNRYYHVDAAGVTLADTSTWSRLVTDLRGSSGTTVWPHTPAPPATNEVQFFRVGVRIP